MRIQVFLFSFSCIIIGMLYAAEIPLATSKTEKIKKVPPSVPQDFSKLAGQPEEVLKEIAANLSDADLARFQRSARPFRSVAQAEFETRASYLWKNGAIQESLPLQAHHGQILAVFVKDNGELVSVGRLDQQIYEWQRDGESFKKIKQIEDDVKSSIERALFSSSSNRLALIHQNNIVNIWDVTSRKKINQFSFDLNECNAKLSPDGAMLTTLIAEDGVFNLWNVITGTSRRINIGVKIFIKTIAFSPDAAKIAILAEGNLIIWNLETNSQDKKFNFEPKFYGTLLFLSDGTPIYYGVDRDDYQLSVWSVQKNEPIDSWVYINYGDITTINLSHNGVILALYSPHYEKIVLRHTQSGKIIREIETPCKISFFAFSPDDKTLVAACPNGDIVTWQVTKKATKSSK